jgi:hypothetical protein
MRISEALDTLKSAGIIVESRIYEHYVFDRLGDVEVPGCVTSRIGDGEYRFSTDEFSDFDGELAIYTNARTGKIEYRVWAKEDPESDTSASVTGELPELFWKNSSYAGGEDSRVSRWILRKLRQMLK